MKFFSLLILLLLVTLSSAVRAEEAQQDMRQLSDSELGTLCGGYELPDGINLNVGIDNTISVNGVQMANASFSMNGSTITTSQSGQYSLQGVGGVTNITQLNAIGQTVIANSANNISINQLRTIDIDMTNATKMMMQSMNTMTAMQLQALNNLRTGIH